MIHILLFILCISSIDFLDINLSFLAYIHETQALKTDVNLPADFIKIKN